MLCNSELLSHERPGCVLAQEQSGMLEPLYSFDLRRRRKLGYVRLHSQLQASALASRWLSDDSFTSKDISHFSISLTQNPETVENSIHNSSSLKITSKEIFSVSLASAMLEVQHREPRISPYGDPENWDLLWLGHWWRRIKDHQSIVHLEP
jgi:hypothetical protein